MIESGVAPHVSGVSGQSVRPSAPLRLLTLDPSQLRDDVPGDLQSLSWLTSVEMHRLQCVAAGTGELVVAPPGGLLAPVQMMSMNGNEGHNNMDQVYKNMQSGLLGMSIVSGHHGNMTASQTGQQYPVIFQESLQQVFALAPFGQQCPPARLHGNDGLPDHSVFAQPCLSPESSRDPQPTSFPKPIYSYSCLIAMALKNSKTGSLPVSEIYNFMKEHFPYFKTAPDGWKNSVRHNLSLNKCFEKLENKLSGSSRKGCLWALNPARIDKMEEEMQKWKRKDLLAIRRSMANPDELDKLIMDRPESCQRKPRDPSVNQLPPQPIPSAVLPTQFLPQSYPVHSLHHQQLLDQAQVQVQLVPGFSSPSPASVSPVHTVPDLDKQQAGPADLCDPQGDVSPEVDTLDPSIMDFALHGDLWEEMKDESFNLDALGSVSNSPLRLSDCDLPQAGPLPTSDAATAPDPAIVSFSDLQLTGLYANLVPLDAAFSPSQYTIMQGGSEPISLL
ncbi:forkhead box protein N4-like [Scleropages formosus]|uniref:forkhead box protein N4-like n=1 Tax=Scleropages formosus TaxID=113540 RepID=UPI0008789B8C|nr:forkhead box protein N4-like [Scleropages formosus]